MAKKIWAYAVDSTGKYVVGEEHPYRMFFVWEAKKIKKENLEYYNQLKFMSTQRLVEERRFMNIHPNGFFRYNAGQAPREQSDQDTDNVSHMMAIAALSRLKALTFICEGTRITIYPKTVDLECRIQLITNGEYKYYIADLVFTFDSNNHWAKKWGSKLAVEVKYTHACEDIKVKDFLNHQIPIIEIDINEFSIVKQFETKTPDQEQLEEYFEILKKLFSKDIPGKLLADPVSLNYFKEQIAKKNTDIKTIQTSLEEEKLKVQESSEIIEKLDVAHKNMTVKCNAAVKKLRHECEEKDHERDQIIRQRNELTSQIKVVQRAKETLQEELQAERSKGFWARVFGL